MDMASFTVVLMLVDRTKSDETTRRTDMVIVEDTQGSPSDTVGVQRMDIEDNPVQNWHPSASMEDVHMEMLDLGSENDNTEHVSYKSPPLCVVVRVRAHSSQAFA